MVCLPLGFVGSPPFLLILSGQAKYFFIPFKGTCKPNQRKQQEQNKNILNTNEKIKRRKNWERKWPCINDSKFKRAQQPTGNTDINIKLDRIILVTEMRCKINSSRLTHSNMINRLYPRHYSHPVRLHGHSNPYTQTPSTGLRHPSFKEGAGKWCSECAIHHITASHTSTRTHT